MKVRKQGILLALVTTLLGISAAHASSDALETVLSCHFERQGVKGQCDRECTATFAQPLDTRQNSPYNVFEVKCDDGTVYNGGGFTKTEEFTNDPQFGMGIVTAINGSILPTYPSVFVDGDFQDFSHGFENRAARLYFSETDYLLGDCDHEIAVP